MSTIDPFKYKVLLAELEALKEKKGPIPKFIKKIFTISDKFSIRPENMESTRYAFMLVTRAINYHTGVRTITRAMDEKIEYAARMLCNSKTITPDNILETFKFWKVLLTFYPRSLKQLLNTEPLVEVLKLASHSYDISLSYTRELHSVTTNARVFVKLYLLSTIGPQSTILAYLGNTDRLYTAEIIPELEEHLQNIQLILKEAHEQHRLSSTTI